MSDWSERHDVFSVPFTTIVILTIVRSHQEAHGRDDDIRLGDLSEQRFLRTLGTRALVLVERSNIDSNIDWPVSGPYYREAGTLCRVARQYEDSQHAFFSTITQRQVVDGFSFSENRPTTHLSVPSRLYYPEPSPEQPLSGLRFAVKDVFDVADLKTSVGSRDFYNFCPNGIKPRWRSLDF